METVSENSSFGGTQGVYKHASDACSCDMTFAVYTPPQAARGPVPVLYYLSGLTCTHANAMEKAGAQRAAAEHGVALIFPDTSPRGDDVADDDAYDLGKGAGFYVDATEAPWKPHFNMLTYIRDELPALLHDRLPDLDTTRAGITGHSMGGHGAMTIALNNPGRYRSLSAFAPICNPHDSDWGRKQLTAYLGADESKWGDTDASKLVREKGWHDEILVDQGGADNFIDLLKTQSLLDACDDRRQAARITVRPGYDHSYYFVSTFIPDHVAFHAQRLG
jgi:S-formylglutathione hydrolase